MKVLDINGMSELTRLRRRISPPATWSDEDFDCSKEEEIDFVAFASKSEDIGVEGPRI